MSPQLGETTMGHAQATAVRPGYDPAAHGVGIVHIGCGAFHRAHQAVYTDDALARSGGDWRIIGVSLRSTEIVDALNAQSGLYTLITRGAGGTHSRIVASLAEARAASRDVAHVLAALVDPNIHLVTLTVTEKAYGIDRTAGDIDETHAAVAADLARPDAPTGVLGLLTEGLRRRRQAGIPPFTVLCCDNLPDNGHLLRTGVTAFARRIDPELADFIAQEVAFPCSMVDRITPAPTAQTRAEAERQTGLEDLAAVETEPFTQWVIEDRFPAGRPDWEAGGALFVDDVAPYERMKLRMLNGTHSMLAYAGFLAGCVYVRDVMADASLAALVKRHLAAAAATLEPLDGIDRARYAEQLAERFANPAIAHATYQIAMDGTEKLAQRIAAPAVAALEQGTPTRPFAFALAMWMRYCLGRSEAGETYDLRDPREASIAAAVAQAGDDGHALAAALFALRDVSPQRLAADAGFQAQVGEILNATMANGVRAVIDAEAQDRAATPS
ncbi:mannitol dehydrogenase family protein [Rhodovibrio salinarum]|uniref:Mannitol dehydrogenase family protein n=1 Tax=Rhodovibrio salinarum TaxID=1087 RepID=A0A934QLL0_9PROT|nr:mannitol dehydrogenase family protein [Rhodovibrio salinarum]MBK1699141.1 mannitol dehydrogenase family protein [Rhodovibrio salinarum]